MKNNLFQLTFPDTWKETTVYTFEGPFDNGVQHNLVLTVDPNIPKDISIADYAKGQCETTASMLPGFEFVDQKETVLPSGISAYEITYKYVPADSLTLFQKQWYMFIENKTYIFSSTFNKKTLNTIAKDVAEIIASLDIGED